MAGNKTAISQRWEETFQKKIKLAASKYGTSMTQLTVEALSIYLELSNSEEFVDLKPGNRKKMVVDAIKQELKSKSDKPDEQSSINTEGILEVGLIRDKVEHLLVINPNHEFSTNDIADVLQIPQSTARTYVRQLYEENSGKFVLVKGRPNKIYYNLSKSE